MVKNMKSFIFGVAVLVLSFGLAKADCVQPLAPGQYLTETPAGGPVNVYHAICDGADGFQDYEAAIAPDGNFYLFNITSNPLQCDPTSSGCSISATAVWGYYGGQGSFLYMGTDGALYFYGSAWQLYGAWCGGGAGCPNRVANSSFSVRHAAGHMFLYGPDGTINDTFGP